MEDGISNHQSWLLAFEFLTAGELGAVRRNAQNNQTIQNGRTFDAPPSLPSPLDILRRPHAVETFMNVGRTNFFGVGCFPWTGSASGPSNVAVRPGLPSRTATPGNSSVLGPADSPPLAGRYPHYRARP